MWGRTSSAPRVLDGLAARRRRSRHVRRAASFTLLLLLLAATLYGLNQPEVRVVEIAVTSGDPTFAEYAWRAMEGSYLGLVPRDSVVFVPKRAIRKALLADHLEIAAVSLSHKGLNTLVLEATERTAVARWCSFALIQDVEEYCYLFDPNGYIFAAAETASTTSTLNPFALYAPTMEEAQEPLRSTLADADKLPSVFDFARRLGSMNALVRYIIIRDGEVNHHLESGTRITYVLGREQDAMTALVSAKSNVDLVNGSIEYVDLRFDRKVYIKRK